MTKYFSEPARNGNYAFNFVGLKTSTQETTLNLLPLCMPSCGLYHLTLRIPTCVATHLFTQPKATLGG